MPSFLSKLLGKKKHSDTPGLLDGERYEAVPADVPSSAPVPETVTPAKSSSHKLKGHGISLTLKRRAHSPPPPPEREPIEPAPHLSLDFPGSQAQEKQAPDSNLGLAADESTIVNEATIRQKRLTPAEALYLVQKTSEIITERGLEVLGVMRPHWFASPNHQEAQLKLLSCFLQSLAARSLNERGSSSVISEDAFENELRYSRDPHDVAAVFRWGLRHLQLESNSLALTTVQDWYQTFATTERSEGYPFQAFDRILPPLLPPTHTQLIRSILDLVTSLAAHSEENGISGNKLSKALGWWLISSGSLKEPEWPSFYSEWEMAARQFEHLFLAFIRTQDTHSRMPKRLTELIKNYPFEKNHKPDDGIFLPRTRFSTRTTDALFIRIAVQSNSESSNIHPLRIITNSLKSLPDADVSGDYLSLWESIREAAKTSTEEEDKDNNSTKFNLSAVFADESLRLLSLVPGMNDLPDVSVFPSHASRRSYSFIERPLSLASNSDAKSPIDKTYSPSTQNLDLDHVTDWQAFSSTGFRSPSDMSLSASLWDNDIEVSTPPSRKGPKHALSFSSSSEPPLPEEPSTPQPVSATAGQSTMPVEISNNYAVTFTSPTLVKLDEAFVDFWADTLLDSVVQTWPTFVVCQLKPMSHLKVKGSSKPIEWIVIEQVVATQPVPVKEAEVEVLPPVPSTPTKNESSKSHGLFSFTSPGRKRWSLFSSKHDTTPLRSRRSSSKVSEMGEVLKEEDETPKPSSDVSMAPRHSDDSSSAIASVPKPEPVQEVSKPDESTSNLKEHPKTDLFPIQEEIPPPPVPLKEEITPELPPKEQELHPAAQDQVKEDETLGDSRISRVESDTVMVDDAVPLGESAVIVPEFQEKESPEIDEMTHSMATSAALAPALETHVLPPDSTPKQADEATFEDEQAEKTPTASDPDPNVAVSTETISSDVVADKDNQEPIAPQAGEGLKLDATAVPRSDMTFSVVEPTPIESPEIKSPAAVKPVIATIKEEDEGDAQGFEFVQQNATEEPGETFAPTMAVEAPRVLDDVNETAMSQDVISEEPSSFSGQQAEEAKDEVPEVTETTVDEVARAEDSETLSPASLQIHIGHSTDGVTHLPVIIEEPPTQEIAKGTTSESGPSIGTPAPLTEEAKGIDEELRSTEETPVVPSEVDTARETERVDEALAAPVKIPEEVQTIDKEYDQIKMGDIAESSPLGATETHAFEPAVVTAEVIDNKEASAPVSEPPGIIPESLPTIQGTSIADASVIEAVPVADTLRAFEDTPAEQNPSQETNLIVGSTIEKSIPAAVIGASLIPTLEDQRPKDHEVTTVESTSEEQQIVDVSEEELPPSTVEQAPPTGESVENEESVTADVPIVGKTAVIQVPIIKSPEEIPDVPAAEVVTVPKVAIVEEEPLQNAAVDVPAADDDKTEVPDQSIRNNEESISTSNVVTGEDVLNVTPSFAEETAVSEEKHTPALADSIPSDIPAVEKAADAEVGAQTVNSEARTLEAETVESGKENVTRAADVSIPREPVGVDEFVKEITEGQPVDADSSLADAPTAHELIQPAIEPPAEIPVADEYSAEMDNAAVPVPVEESTESAPDHVDTVPKFDSVNEFIPEESTEAQEIRVPDTDVIQPFVAPLAVGGEPSDPISDERPEPTSISGAQVETEVSETPKDLVVTSDREQKTQPQYNSFAKAETSPSSQIEPVEDEHVLNRAADTNVVGDTESAPTTDAILETSEPKFEHATEPQTGSESAQPSDEINVMKVEQSLIEAPHTIDAEAQTQHVTTESAVPGAIPAEVSKDSDLEKETQVADALLQPSDPQIETEPQAEGLKTLLVEAQPEFETTGLAVVQSSDEGQTESLDHAPQVDTPPAIEVPTVPAVIEATPPFEAPEEIVEPEKADIVESPPLPELKQEQELQTNGEPTEPPREAEVPEAEEELTDATPAVISQDPQSEAVTTEPSTTEIADLAKTPKGADLVPTEVTTDLTQSVQDVQPIPEVIEPVETVPEPEMDVTEPKTAETQLESTFSVPFAEAEMESTEESPALTHDSAAVESTKLVDQDVPQVLNSSLADETDIAVENQGVPAQPSVPSAANEESRASGNLTEDLETQDAAKLNNPDAVHDSFSATEPYGSQAVQFSSDDVVINVEETSDITVPVHEKVVSQPAESNATEIPLPESSRGAAVLAEDTSPGSNISIPEEETPPPTDAIAVLAEPSSDEPVVEGLPSNIEVEPTQPAQLSETEASEQSSTMQHVDDTAVTDVPPIAAPAPAAAEDSPFARETINPQHPIPTEADILLIAKAEPAQEPVPPPVSDSEGTISKEPELHVTDSTSVPEIARPVETPPVIEVLQGSPTGFLTSIQVISEPDTHAAPATEHEGETSLPQIAVEPPTEERAADTQNLGDDASVALEDTPPPAETAESSLQQIVDPEVKEDVAVAAEDESKDPAFDLNTVKAVNSEQPELRTSVDEPQNLNVPAIVDETHEDNAPSEVLMHEPKVDVPEVREDAVDKEVISTDSLPSDIVAQEDANSQIQPVHDIQSQSAEEPVPQIDIRAESANEPTSSDNKLVESATTQEDSTGREAELAQVEPAEVQGNNLIPEPGDEQLSSQPHISSVLAEIPVHSDDIQGLPSSDTVQTMDEVAEPVAESKNTDFEISNPSTSHDIAESIAKPEETPENQINEESVQHPTDDGQGIEPEKKVEAVPPTVAAEETLSEDVAKPVVDEVTRVEGIKEANELMVEPVAQDVAEAAQASNAPKVELEPDLKGENLQLEAAEIAEEVKPESEEATNQVDSNAVQAEPTNSVLQVVDVPPVSVQENDEDVGLVDEDVSAPEVSESLPTNQAVSEKVDAPVQLSVPTTNEEPEGTEKNDNTQEAASTGIQPEIDSSGLQAANTVDDEAVPAVESTAPDPSTPADVETSTQNPSIPILEKTSQPVYHAVVHEHALKNPVLESSDVVNVETLGTSAPSLDVAGPEEEVLQPTEATSIQAEPATENPHQEPLHDVDVENPDVTVPSMSNPPVPEEEEVMPQPTQDMTAPLTEPGAENEEAPETVSLQADASAPEQTEQLTIDTPLTQQVADPAVIAVESAVESNSIPAEDAPLNVQEMTDTQPNVTEAESAGEPAVMPAAVRPEETEATPAEDALTPQVDVDPTQPVEAPHVVETEELSTDTTAHNEPAAPETEHEGEAPLPSAVVPDHDVKVEPLTTGEESEVDSQGTASFVALAPDVSSRNGNPESVVGPEEAQLERNSETAAALSDEVPVAEPAPIAIGISGVDARDKTEPMDVEVPNESDVDVQVEAESVLRDKTAEGIDSDAVAHPPLNGTAGINGVVMNGGSSDTPQSHRQENGVERMLADEYQSKDHDHSVAVDTGVDVNVPLKGVQLEDGAKREDELTSESEQREEVEYTQ